MDLKKSEKIQYSYAMLTYTPSFWRFILDDLDDVHLFVASDVAHLLQEKLDELMEKNSYNPLEAEQAKS